MQNLERLLASNLNLLPFLEVVQLDMFKILLAISTFLVLFIFTLLIKQFQRQRYITSCSNIYNYKGACINCAYIVQAIGCNLRYYLDSNNNFYQLANNTLTPNYQLFKIAYKYKPNAPNSSNKSSNNLESSSNITSNNKTIINPKLLNNSIRTKDSLYRGETYKDFIGVDL